MSVHRQVMDPALAKHTESVPIVAAVFCEKNHSVFVATSRSVRYTRLHACMSVGFADVVAVVAVAAVAVDTVAVAAPVDATVAVGVTAAAVAVVAASALSVVCCVPVAYWSLPTLCYLLLFYIRELSSLSEQVSVWSALTGSLVRLYRDISHSDITSFILDGCQRRFIVGFADGSLKEMNCSNGALIRTIVSPGEHFRPSAKAEKLSSSFDGDEVRAIVPCGSVSAASLETTHALSICVLSTLHVATLMPVVFLSPALLDQQLKLISCCRSGALRVHTTAEVRLDALR